MPAKPASQSGRPWPSLLRVTAAIELSCPRAEEANNVSGITAESRAEKGRIG
jgi:hypothetical protein